MGTRGTGRLKRHRRIRKRVAGFPDRPRMSVFRSHKHLYVQLVNDLEGRTLLGRSTRAEAVRKTAARGGTIEAARQLGRVFAADALKQGVTRVVFDRGGYRYHGRVRALAEAARETGLEF